MQQKELDEYLRKSKFAPVRSLDCYENHIGSGLEANLEVVMFLLFKLVYKSLIISCVLLGKSEVLHAYQIEVKLVFLGWVIF